MAMSTPSPRRILFARIGWMQFYAGAVPGDPRPVGGGGYNVENIGSEVCNFKKRGRLLLGFFETPRQTNLSRIDPAAGDLDALDRVLVIFVSKRPRGKQVVVGWYRNATVLRVSKARPGADSRYSYNCLTSATNGVLLPDAKRTFRIPWGAGCA